MSEQLTAILEWFIVNPWASFIGVVISGFLLRLSVIKGYGARNER